MKYTKSLRFEEDPDYAYLKGLLKEVFVKQNYEYDFDFDWCSKLISLERRIVLGNTENKFISQQKPIKKTPNIELAKPVIKQENIHDSKDEENKENLKKDANFIAPIPGQRMPSFDKNENSMAVNFPSLPKEPSPRLIIGYAQIQKQAGGPYFYKKLFENRATDVPTNQAKKKKESCKAKCGCALL